MHEIGETMTKHLINFLLKSNFDFKKAMKNYKYYNAIEKSGLFASDWAFFLNSG